MSRARIDLNGVALVNADEPAGAVIIFRYRTAEGLIVLVPESADTTIPWDAVEHAGVDLLSGELHVHLAEDFVGRHNWLRGATRLRGPWTDRLVMTAKDAKR